MSFTWTEIKKWAKEKNLEPKKNKEGKYIWEDNVYNNLDDLVTALWNRASNNKWVEYQEEYKKSQANKK